MHVRSLCLLPTLAGCGSATSSDGGAPDGAVPVDNSVPPADAGAPPDSGSPPDRGSPPDQFTTLLPETEFLDGTTGLDGPVVDGNADEGGNLWVVVPDALYVRRAGETRFRRYTNADGLHIYSYITAVAGGGPGEGYVGLEGHDAADPNLDPLEVKQQGHAEHVHLHADGTIDSLHYADLHTDVSANYWENPSTRRLLYVHDGPAAGHLFMGMNHGVDHVYRDTWGDHVHVEVYLLPEHSGSYGEWYGLAVDPTTHGLWTCGKEACGLEQWNADPRAWVAGRYDYAFTVFTSDHGLEVPHGYQENFVGAAATPDGTAWFLSKPFGLASWQPRGRNADYQHIRNVTVPGLGTPVDIAADPDGTLWIADTGQVLRYDPATGAAKSFPVPSGTIRRLSLDASVHPRALYVATGNGLLIYRGK